MGNYFLKIMADTNGNPSSKRWFALVSFLCMIFTLFADIFFDITVAEYLYEGFVWLTIGGVIGSTVEHFAKRNRGKEEVDPYGYNIGHGPIEKVDEL